MNKTLIATLLLITAVACQNKKAAEEAMAKAAQITADSLAAVQAAKVAADAQAAAAASADTLFWANPLGTKLRGQLVANPANQADMDKNIILTYAAKNNLDIKVTKTGLAYIEDAVGKGTSPKVTDAFTCNYKGYYLDGREFDSSAKNGGPVQFNVSQMITGWQEALQMMKPGGKMKLIVPSGLAYGAQGHPAGIPGNTVLAFDMELVSVPKK